MEMIPPPFILLIFILLYKLCKLYAGTKMEASEDISEEMSYSSLLMGVYNRTPLVARSGRIRKEHLDLSVENLILRHTMGAKKFKDSPRLETLESILLSQRDVLQLLKELEDRKGRRRMKEDLSFAATLFYSNIRKSNLSSLQKTLVVGIRTN